ncbi:MAG: DNA/RNA non-specific endonuclease [Saprospiraceae bacterium]
MIHRLLLFLLALSTTSVFSQNLEAEKQRIETSLDNLEQQKIKLKDDLETVRFKMINRDLIAIGLPSDNYVMHKALALEYSEAHEQARWVAHIIVPEVKEGVVFRSNDFRPDPMISTGSAVEADYFLKQMKPDSTWAYDGFGYDRGHLAPSADFRWSEKALSESYLYSNMSPQVAEFNRGKWAELEALIRDYVINHPGVQLYVVTGPVLEENLPVIERSINKVAIPKKYFKVALDIQNKRAIGFIMPNVKIENPVESFAVPVDVVEEATGLDFFNKLPDDVEDNIESSLDKSAWFPTLSSGDTEHPINPNCRETISIRW